MDPPPPASTPANAERFELLGLRISRVDRAAALALLRGYLAGDAPRLVVTVDASGVVIGAQDAEYRAIVNAAALATPDGAGILWAARRRGVPLAERVPGVEIAEAICAEAALRGRSVFLYGGTPGVAEEAARRLAERHPGLRVAGTAHGYLDEAEQAALVERIRAARPGVLLAALGIPRQEKWLARHLQALQVPVCIGVGGTLDVWSGRVQRAPAWMQRRGLEWLYRLLRDPRKIRKVALLPRFAWLVLRAGRR